VDFPLLAPEPETPPRFPVGPFGYNRTAVDEYVAELERELEELRRQTPVAETVSITDEIERIGEQTSSILVVAHDQAHETTRLAREKADRWIAEAAAQAEEITQEAERTLRELDSETDAVWRERRKLLEDVRCTGAALIGLADEATERFPGETEPEAVDAFDRRFEPAEPEAVDTVGDGGCEPAEPEAVDTLDS
jgi:cell division septum initiation protein DivIVA